MRTKLLNIWESIRISFWFIPGLMGIGAIALAFLLVWVDQTEEIEKKYLSFLLTNVGTESARAILSTIASSMITVAGTVFSITIVALTLASSQFGPRLLRTFMKDRRNQFVLGTFIATFIYCLLVLQSVHSFDDQTFVPRLSISFAALLTLLSASVLIYFIHHISISIQADQVIAAVYRDLEQNLKRLFPEELGKGANQNDGEDLLAEKEISNYSLSCKIKAPNTGYLQAIEGERLIKLAESKDFFIRIHYRPRHYITKGSPLAEFHSNFELTEELKKSILECFIVGAQRSPEQDTEFAIHQLVEIALRGLSPSINDPYTAMVCVDRLGSALAYLADRAFPSKLRLSDGGKIRVEANAETFEGITNAAFNQIRQHGQLDVAVQIRLLETLKVIMDLTTSPKRMKALTAQAELIHDSVSTNLSGSDLADALARYKACMAAAKSQKAAKIALV